MTLESAQSGRWNPTAAIAGWIIPGLGHMLAHQRKRGILLCVAIVTLWVLGLFIGGLGVIDRHSYSGWYLAQVLLAPSLLVDYLVTMDRQSGQAIVQGYGRMTDLGILFTALAGMLNLMAVIDVLYREPSELAAEQQAQAEPTHDDEAPPDAASATQPDAESEPQTPDAAQESAPQPASAGAGERP